MAPRPGRLHARRCARAHVRAAAARTPSSGGHPTGASPPLVSVDLPLPQGGTMAVVKPRSSEEAYEWYVDAGMPDADPWWADLWPASVVLAEHVCTSDAVRGKRVADLGCGLGVAGTSAMMRGGASHVALLDYEPPALVCALATASANRVETFDASAVPLGAASATGAIPYLFDWTQDVPPLDVPFDVVLAADVLYDAQHIPCIARAVAALLGTADGAFPPGGTLILADRQTGTARDAFYAHLKNNFAAEVVSEETVAGETMDVVLARIAAAADLDGAQPLCK